MPALALRASSALVSGCFAAVIACPAFAEANETASLALPVERMQQAGHWTDAEVAEHAARLAGPTTIAVVHFRTASCARSEYAPSWFDRFEKQVAGEALQELGVREAVAVVDLGAFGRPSTRTIVRMNESYLDSPTAEADLRALFAPLGEQMTFHERTLNIAHDEEHVSSEQHATFDADCIARRLAVVGPSPLRIVTVEPCSQKDEEAFVSLPETPASNASAGTCLGLGFDYRSSTGTLRIVSDGPAAVEFAIDEESGRAPTLRAFARMARAMCDRLLTSNVALADANAPETGELAEIASPPFGLPLTQ